jgi:hypothetical protein
VTLLVSIESPFAGDHEANIRYAQKACLDSLKRGESPYASHLFFTQFLSDSDPTQREQGLAASDAWRRISNRLVFYVDLGFSPGMHRALELAKSHSIPVEFRALQKPITTALLASFGIEGLPDGPDSVPEQYFDNTLIELDYTDLELKP